MQDTHFLDLTEVPKTDRWAIVEKFAQDFNIKLLSKDAYNLRYTIWYFSGFRHVMHHENKEDYNRFVGNSVGERNFIEIFHRVPIDMKSIYSL